MTNTFYTDYRTAAYWGNTSLVLCNNIPEIDPSVWENARFQTFDEETGRPAEVMQWYITDLTTSGVEYMEQTFDLHYTYSDLLDCYILCVFHWGTPWNGVRCEVKSQTWIESNKDLEYTGA